MQVMKLASELDAIGRQKESEELSVGALQKRIAGLEAQLAETQDLLQDETRLKLAQQTRVRQLEADLVSQQVRSTWQS